MKSVNKTFPSVSDYVESLINPTGRFASLEKVRAVTDTDGEPVYISKTGRVTFRVFLRDTDELFEMTCFTSSAMAESVLNGETYSGQILMGEIYAFNHNQTGGYYPIVLQRVETGTEDDATDSMDGLLAEPKSGEMYEGRRIIVLEGLFGYADETGAVIVEPIYTWAGDFSEGRAMVAVSAPVGEGVLMGLIDKQGNLVIPAEYDDLSWDNSRYAYLEREGQHGCLDRMGQIVIPLEYDWTGEFNHGFAVVCLDDKYGYVDATGSLVGEGLIYADATSVSENGTADVLLTDETERTEIHLS